MTGEGLEISGLSVGYGKRPVLTGIDLPPLAPGQLVAVLGPNAAGKSTLLKALAGHLSYRGVARFRGLDLAQLGHRRRTRLVGYVPQTPPQPSSLLAYEFAVSALRVAVPDLTAATAAVRIDAAFERLGLSDQALRPVQELSGGKRQLLGLAQAIVRDAPLLLLDEPTSALDLRWEVEALGVLRDLARHEARDDPALCLIALHDLNLALRFCDQVILLSGGGVLAAGPAAGTLTPARLHGAYGVIARIEACSLGQPFVVVDRAVAAHEHHHARNPDRIESQ